MSTEKQQEQQDLKRMEADRRYVRKLILTFTPFTSQRKFIKAIDVCLENAERYGRMKLAEEIKAEIHEHDDLDDLAYWANNQAEAEREYLDPKG